MNKKARATESDHINAALGQALRRLRAASGVSQVELSKRLDVDQTSVSRWERGLDLLSAHKVPQIEDALDQPRGSLWATADLLDLGPVEQAVYADTELGVPQQETLIAVYRSLRGQSGGDGTRPT